MNAAGRIRDESLGGRGLFKRNYHVIKNTVD
jgi:hypothetical protein